MGNPARFFPSSCGMRQVDGIAWSGPQRKGVEIDGRGRDGQQRTVEAVEHAAVAGQDVPAVLQAQLALEQALHQVAPGAEHDHHDHPEPEHPAHRAV